MDNVDKVQKIYKINGKIPNKNPHLLLVSHGKKDVDNVDKLFLQKVFTYFHYVSCAHCYQQIIVDTFF